MEFIGKFNRILDAVQYRFSITSSFNNIKPIFIPFFFSKFKLFLKFWVVFGIFPFARRSHKYRICPTLTFRRFVRFVRFVRFLLLTT